MGFFFFNQNSTTVHTMKNMPEWSYHDRLFRSVANSTNGEVSDQTTFHYRQFGNVISATYEGGPIKEGNLLGTVDIEGKIRMRYQHWNEDNEFRAGICTSTPELLPNGKIRLHERWEWTNGVSGSGESVIEEI